MSGSSPRDRQMKAMIEAQSQMSHNTDSGLIATLTEQVVQLRNELAKRPTQGYTDEEFNSEVIKAVEASIAKEREANSRYILELETKLKQQGDTPETLAKLIILEGEVSSLKATIKGKEETIDALKSRPVNVLMGDSVTPEYEGVNKSNRPQMEENFIDPSEQKDYKSNISVDDVKDTQKEDMSNKVNKLKDLLGGGVG